jgi:hypothetical protein
MKTFKTFLAESESINEGPLMAAGAGAALAKAMELAGDGVAGAAEQVQRIRHAMSRDRRSYDQKKAAERKRANPERHPGDVWETGGSWAGMGPNGRTRYFDKYIWGVVGKDRQSAAKHRAERWAKGDKSA